MTVRTRRRRTSGTAARRSPGGGRRPRSPPSLSRIRAGTRLVRGIRSGGSQRHRLPRPEFRAWSRSERVRWSSVDCRAKLRTSRRVFGQVFDHLGGGRRLGCGQIGPFRRCPHPFMRGLSTATGPADRVSWRPQRASSSSRPPWQHVFHRPPACARHRLPGGR